MNAQKNLKNLLDACVKRCKAADQFREGVYGLAKLAVGAPEAQREALLAAICELCDPNYVKRIDERAKPVVNTLGVLSNNHGPGSPVQRSESPEGEERSGSTSQQGSVVKQV